jgi:hypothetical protein
MVWSSREWYVSTGSPDCCHPHHCLGTTYRLSWRCPGHYVCYRGTEHDNGHVYHSQHIDAFIAGWCLYSRKIFYLECRMLSISAFIVNVGNPSVRAVIGPIRLIMRRIDVCIIYLQVSGCSPQTCAIIYVSTAYDIMLKGNPRKASTLRWYMLQESSPVLETKTGWYPMTRR